MDFNIIDLNKIIIEKSIKNSYEVKYNNYNIDFWTPTLFIPFGVDKKFNNYFLNCQINSNELFIHFIESLENKFVELLKISKNELNSQLRSNDNILYTKFLQRNNKIISSIKNNNTNLTIYNIEKKCDCKIRLSINKIWQINNIYYYKFIIKELIIY